MHSRPVLSPRGMPGAALIEALLSLCLIALLCLAGMDVFASGRRVFFRLDVLQEREERAAAGLDRIRLDVRQAGLGLEGPSGLGLLTGLAAREDGLLVSSLEESVPLSADTAAGDSFLPLTATKGFAAGRTVCVFAPGRGEIASVSDVREDGVALSAPLLAGYPAASASLLLVRTVEVLWDRDGLVLRRRVNGGSAQPLVEGTSAFRCRLDPALQVLELELFLDGHEENPYAAAILPKNVLLSGVDPD